MGFRERALARLNAIGMTRQELALRTGLSKSYIYKLLSDGPGNRENPSADVKERIAAALGLSLSDLDETEDLAASLITRLYELPLSERRRLGSVSPNERFILVMTLMKQDERWPDDHTICQVLGIPEETYVRLLEGSPMDQAIIKHLAEHTGLSVRFWLRGRLDPNPRLLNLLVESDQVAEILEIAERIIDGKVSAEVVRDVVEAVAKGGA